ncbi:MAG: PEP-CTERM system TPR-repeat protein PrsT [Burkholderiales bacterium]|nr:PEP-CTERM system TPR-repeat protein PrsT [Burkholderiales bacterium]
MTPFARKRILLPVILLALAGCKGDKSEDFVASGRAFLDKRDFSAALIQLKNAVQNDSGSGEARYWLGVALRGSGDAPAAEIELRKAAATGYAPDLVMPELVATLMEMGQFDKALVEAGKAKVTSPRAQADLLAAQATAHLANDEIHDARRLANEAVAADASSPAAQVVRAKLLVLDRKVDDAQQVLTAVLAGSSDNYEALRMQADLLLAQGKIKEAIADYDRVIAVRPTSVSAYLTLIPTLIRERDIPGAETRLASLRKVAGGAPGTRYLEALIAYAKGDRKTARDAVQQVLKTGADYLPALLLAGTVEHDLGNYLLAEDLLRKVASAAPNDLRSRRLLISTYLQTNQVKQARDALAALMKLDPHSAATNVLAGRVATASRDPVKAAEFFQKAVALDPKNTTSRTLLGAADMMRGNVERGVAELEAASAADPDRIEADVALIRYFMEQKQLDKAAKAVEALARKQPNNPQAANLRGGVLLARGDVAGARKAFEAALVLQPTFTPAAKNLAALDLRDRKPEAAMERYRNILTKDPKQTDAALMLAFILERNGGKVAEVDKVLNDAVSADPANVQVRLAQISRYLQSGRKKEALDSSQQALATVPDDPRLLAVLGRAQMVNGEFARAASTFGKLATLDSRSVDPLVRQASAYAASNDFTSARSVLNKAIAMQPDNVMLHAALVDLGLSELKPEVAITDARSMQKKWPKSSAGYVAEAAVLLKQRRPKEAEALLRTATGGVEDAGTALQLFSLLLKTDRAEEAEKFAAEFIASRPKDAALAAAAGEDSLARHDYATAARWYRAALKARPDNPILLNNLAWALGQLNDPQAMATAERARALAPNTPAIIDTIGWLQLQQGDAETAVTTLARAVSLAPGAAAVRMNLARALIAAGRKDDAREQLQAIAGLTAPQTIKDEAEKLLGSL